MATICNQFRESVIKSISNNIGSILIYNPLLGRDYSLTQTQLELRKESTFKEIVNYEVLATLENDYKRFFPSNTNLKHSSSFSSLDFNASFTANTERIGPFTHIATGYNLNPYIDFGKGRGDTQGILINIESVLDKQAIQLEQNSKEPEFYIEPYNTYSMFISLNLSSRMLVN